MMNELPPSSPIATEKNIQTTSFLEGEIYTAFNDFLLKFLLCESLCGVVVADKLVQCDLKYLMKNALVNAGMKIGKKSRNSLPNSTYIELLMLFKIIS